LTPNLIALPDHPDPLDPRSMRFPFSPSVTLDLSSDTSHFQLLSTLLTERKNGPRAAGLDEPGCGLVLSIVPAELRDMRRPCPAVTALARRWVFKAAHRAGVGGQRKISLRSMISKRQSPSRGDRKVSMFW
jgi:hypothetical protein